MSFKITMSSHFDWFDMQIFKLIEIWLYVGKFYVTDNHSYITFFYLTNQINNTVGCKSAFWCSGTYHERMTQTEDNCVLTNELLDLVE